MTRKLCTILCSICLITLFSGCKFIFSESEYLGTYPGYFDSDTGIYEDCNGTAILTDVGDNLVNIELITDSNSTIYFNALKVERGYSLSSDNLRIDGDNIDVWINRNTHSIRLAHYTASMYDYEFNGERQ